MTLLVRRVNLLKRLRAIAMNQGETLVVVSSAKHDFVQIGQRTQVIPRHLGVNEFTAKRILKEMER